MVTLFFRTWGVYANKIWESFPYFRIMSRFKFAFINSIYSSPLVKILLIGHTEVIGS